MISNIAELNAVYPRWRGELTNAAHQGVSSSGLSPLARGTRHMPDHMCSNGRFIPAGAGNSRCMTGKPQTGAVYPRWRGELTMYDRKTSDWRGLSPLARGTRRVIFPENNKARFIPAGAGNSRARGDSGRACTVYPRWRGELAGMLRSVFDKLGLSPLARGTLISLAIINRLTRFIPAGAGNSLNITYY